MKLRIALLLIVSILLTNRSFSQDQNFYIYLCFGQSNMQGATKWEAQDTVAIPRFLMMSPMDCPGLDRKMGEWYPGIPPLANCNAGLSPADYFGRKMTENLPENVKVGVINVSVGGCKIELFDKDNYQQYVKTAPDWMLNWINEYGGNPYERLVELAKKAQKEGVIKGILMHQGESNTGDKEWPQKVQGVYNNLLKDLGLKAQNVPLLAGEVLSADENGACARMNTIINTLPGVIPNSYVVPSDGCAGVSDHLHLTAAGCRKLGKRYADVMLGLMGIKPKAPVLTFSSPDEKLVVQVSTKDGRAQYSVSYNGKTFIQPSPLGLNTNVGDFTRNLILKDRLTVTAVKEEYKLQKIKKSNVNYRANEAVVTFLKDDLPAFDVIFRLSDNDMAFRYKLYPQGERISCVVRKEATGFVFPEMTTSFLSMMMEPMGGFARSTPSYESGYQADVAMKENKSPEGYVFPGLFRIGEDGWALVSETGVNSLYCASHLSAYNNGKYTVDYPDPKQNNGFGSTGAQLSLPGYTPWRTITVGENLKPVVETTVPFDVVAPLYESSQEYHLGRGTWSWIVWQDPSMNYEDQLKFIDLASELGYEYILIDAWWDERIGYERMEELVKYAASKNVAVFLWYNSNGGANEAFMTPRNKMNTTVVRKKEMRWLQQTGIKGIKVDFFGGDKQETMRLYEDILSDANDYGLMVDFHGATLPRGWERMYPNYVGSEAVLASEMLIFSQDVREKEAFYATLHPFMRNTVANMEFGGVLLNKFLNKGNRERQQRLTSTVFQLATSVLFQNPVQFFALTPNNLTDAPQWAIDFMKKVPVTWDETRFIDGYPGRYVLLARRHMDTWYIAGVNAQEETLKLKIKLPMLEAGSAIDLYTDDAKLNGKKDSVKLNKKKEVTISIPKNGGLLIKQ